MVHPHASLLRHMAECVLFNTNLENNLTDETLIRFLVPSPERQRKILSICQQARQDGVLREILSLVSYQNMQFLAVAIDEGELGRSDDGSYKLVKVGKQTTKDVEGADLQGCLPDAVIELGIDPPRADLSILD